YDVLEHVRSPAVSTAELFSVLKPGGTALLVFPVYLGMRSHHLDYITSLPGLHWVFSAATLVEAVNSCGRMPICRASVLTCSLSRVGPLTAVASCCRCSMA